VISLLGGGAPGLPPTNPISFGVRLVVTILSSLFGLFGSSPNLDALRRENQVLRDDMSKAVDLANRFTWKTAFAGATVLRALDALWSGPLKQLLTLLKRFLEWLLKTAVRVLVNLARAIHRARELLDKYWEKYVRPVLLVIETIRKYLAILRLFNIKWADKLDGILGRIQAKILEPYLYIIRQLNTLANWQNIILTAGGRIQAPLFLRSLVHYRGYLQRVWFHTFATPGFNAQTQAKGTNRAPMPAAAARAQFSDILASRGEYYGTRVAPSIATFKANLGA
jgi:hypothetical protein